MLVFVATQDVYVFSVYKHNGSYYLPCFQLFSPAFGLILADYLPIR